VTEKSVTMDHFRNKSRHLYWQPCSEQPKNTRKPKPKTELLRSHIQIQLLAYCWQVTGQDWS